MALRQTISLDGLQTVQKELKGLADVGESAFARIRAAVEGGGGGLEGIASNILNIGKALTSLTGAVTVFAGITGGLLGLTVSASNAGEEFENLGAALGVTAGEAEALVSSFARAGADIEGLAQSLRRSARNITTEWAQVQESVRQAGQKTIANNISVAQSLGNLVKANITAANQEHNAALQRQADAQNVAEAQENLNDLLEKRRIRQGGERDPEQEARRAAAREDAQIAKAQLQLDQAEQKAKEEAANAEQKAQDAFLSRAAAQLSVSKALEQSREDQKNSITNLVGFVNELADGLTNTGRKVNRTIDNLFKGIVASAGGLDASLGPIEGDLSNIASPKVVDVLLKTSDVMKNLSNNTERQALLTKLLGRAAGQEAVAFFSQGSEAIKKYLAEVQKIEVDYDHAVEATQKFRRQLFTFEDALTRLKNRIGAIFAPVFGPFFEVLAQLIDKNRGKFLGWAQTLADTVKPTIDSIIRVLSGEATPDDKWLTDLIEKFQNFGRTLRDIVIPAFNSFLSAVGELAKGINNIFGTSLDAVSLLFITWLAKVTGIFRLVGVGLATLGGLFTAFSASVGASIAIPLAALVALAAAVTLILAAMGNKEALAVIDKIKEGLVNLVPAAGSEIVRFFDDLNKGLSGVNKAISESKTNWELFTKLFDQQIQVKIQFPPILTQGWEALTQLFFGPPGSPLRRVFFGESAPLTPSLGAGSSFGAAGSEAAVFAEEAKKAAEEGKKAGEDTVKGFKGAADVIHTATTATTQNTAAITANSLQKKNSIDLTIEETNALHDLIIEQRRAAAPIGAPKFVAAPGESLPAILSAKQGIAPTTAATPEAAQQKAQSAVTAFQTASDEIIKIWNSLKDAIDAVDFSSLFESLPEELAAPFEDAEEAITDVFDAIATEAEVMANKIIESARKAAQAIQSIGFSGFGGSPEGAPFAAGGRVFGPGTWTSDSIPARLSRDEFVQPAMRVHQYGVDFMEAIRQGLLSADLVRMLMGDFRGFSLGGSFSSRAIPSFAAGGSVNEGAMRTLQLVLGNQTFETTGTAKVIDALEREAALAGIASTGIAQSFVGRR